ncbi:hypothetical protein NONI108955_29370 [Nocardia ninae]
MRDGVLDARPFETSFTLNRSSADDAYMIANQIFQVV